jgi:hypothetical protein
MMLHTGTVRVSLLLDQMTMMAMMAMIRIDGEGSEDSGGNDEL